MHNYYFLTGIPRLQAYCLAYLSRGIAYLVPVLMILFEVVFIIDMIGVTSVLVPYLNGARISGG